MNERSLGGGSEQMCLTFPGVEYFLTTEHGFQRKHFAAAFLASHPERLIEATNMNLHNEDRLL